MERSLIKKKKNYVKLYVRLNKYLCNYVKDIKLASNLFLGSTIQIMVTIIFHWYIIVISSIQIIEHIFTVFSVYPFSSLTYKEIVSMRQQDLHLSALGVSIKGTSAALVVLQGTPCHDQDRFFENAFAFLFFFQRGQQYPQ